MSSLFIVIPAYNEAENIERTVSEWYPIVESHNKEGQSRLVIINDGSKDHTYELICKLAQTRPLLIPLTKPNGGHGSTVLYGYRYAIEHKADYIFQTDSDGQTNPDEFEAFWRKRNTYNAIIGNRKVRGDGKSRKFVENTVCLLLRLIFGVKIPDANAPFRLMHTDLVNKYIHRLPKNYNLPNIMLTTYFVYYKEKITFLPITFKPRQAGTNSLNLKKITKIGYQAIKDFHTLKKSM
ncbi:glycosyltransferase family 2 protein [Blautia difficilis]|uniref:Glycosyltransferase family 2 protein n=1 Tax=Blautia difficilis TaxID=2763027 RepID=A0ABR7IGX1_9FIRM|nr:glycosyltransferase family 2 protein [Blautia difficilis]MBC5779278.1 glycosyltransferase family 2 protein [Blautia difficilis]